jgi:ABC-type multidrug transport system permease subunit
MLISALPDAETAGNISTLLYSMMLIFNGVFQPPQALSGFWIFMYYLSPLTYLVSGIVSTGLHERQVVCANNELAVMQPLGNQTCGEYLSPYVEVAGGQGINPGETSNCQYCALTTADQYLARSNYFYEYRWRNWGIGWAYVVFNAVVAMVLYWAFRVRWRKRK